MEPKPLLFLPDDDPNTRPGAPASREEQIKKYSHYTILVVDDESVLAELLSFRLKKLGFQTRVAFNGHESLKKQQREPIDLVVSDIKMNKGSGYEVLRHLSRQNQAAPTILVSAFSDHSLLDIYQAGALAVFPKPVSFRALLQVIERGILAKGEHWSSLLPSVSAHVQLSEGEMAFDTISLGVQGFVFSTDPQYPPPERCRFQMTLPTGFNTQISGEVQISAHPMGSGLYCASFVDLSQPYLHAVVACVNDQQITPAA